MAFPSAIRFLRLAGFDFDRNPEQAELSDYRKDIL